MENGQTGQMKKQGRRTFLKSMKFELLMYAMIPMVLLGLVLLILMAFSMASAMS